MCDNIAMKQFFTIVFGGLFAIFAGIGIAYGSGRLWSMLNNSGATRAISFAAVADAFAGSNNSNTTVVGFKRLIRYSADEEENMINNAAQSLPHNAVGVVTARAYIVKNLNDGSVVAHSNDDRTLPIASVTKLITAVVARRLISPSDHVKIDRNVTTTYGNTAQFRNGEIFLAQDLYYPLLMVSSNDAAEALARHYGRSKFIKAMNDFTQSIGAYATYFADPSGLSPENVSTAKDLSIIIDWIRQNDPAIIDITLQKSMTVKGHTWVNPTHFLNWSNYKGGKNGYIPEAGLTSASLFGLGKDKDLYAIVLLNSASRDADELRLIEKVK